jgi:hypothetical protein
MRDGEFKPVSNMTDEHLTNALSFSLDIGLTDNIYKLRFETSWLVDELLNRDLLIDERFVDAYHEGRIVWTIFNGQPLSSNLYPKFEF